MDGKFQYATSGTCSRLIEFEIKDGRVRNVSFTGGCNGNLKGIGRLVEGKTPGEIIEILEGVTCKDKNTSCPDQLSKALRQTIGNQ